MSVTQDELAEVMVSFSASLQANTSELARNRKRQERLANNIWVLDPGTIPLALSGGAGTLDQPTLLGPRNGQVWDIKRIGLWGFTGTSGTVNIFVDSINGDQWASVNAAGSTFFSGKGSAVLTAGHRLVFQAATITGLVNVNIIGLQISEDVFADYLI